MGPLYNPEHGIDLFIANISDSRFKGPVYSNVLKNWSASHWYASRWYSCLYILMSSKNDIETKQKKSKLSDNKVNELMLSTYSMTCLL